MARRILVQLTISGTDGALGTGSPAPRFYGADPHASLLVLEDLRELDNLVPRLMGDDPKRATDALLRLATTLGRMPCLDDGTGFRLPGNPCQPWPASAGFIPGIGRERYC